MTVSARPAPLPDLRVERPADGRARLAILLAAIGTDVAVRSGVGTLAGAALVVLVSVAVAGSGRMPNPQARVLAVTAAVFGAWLALRTSPWLLPLDILAAAGLLVLASSLAREGDVANLSVPSLVLRAGHALAHAAAAPGFLLGRGDEGARSTAAGSVLRGLALALPVLGLLGVLLASADAVFAGFFRWSDPATVLSHGALLVVGAWGMAALLRVASSRPVPAPPALPYRLGPTEAGVVVGSVVALFSAFALAQAMAASEGGRRVIRTAGLTYAEYARSGFFQLLAVAGITLLTLMALRAVTDLPDPRTRRRFTLLSEAAVALTLVIVAVALRRLALYDQAFGLTLLRLYSAVFAVVIGVIFLLLGVALAGVAPRRAWFVPAAGATALSALLVLNVVNPEALVVRHNVDRAERGRQFDGAYLSRLSDDAVPALVGALPRLDPATATGLLAEVCRRSRPAPRWWAANRSVSRADDARRSRCPQGVDPGGR